MTEEDAVTLREVGEPPSFDFEPRDHLEIGTELGLIDMEAAARVSGSRFAYLKGDLVLLELALVRFAIELVRGEGHEPVVPPVLVREEALVGTGFLPGDRDQIYEVPKDELFLVGTSEVPLAAPARRPDPRRRRPAAALRRVLDLLPPRGRRRRPRHARHLPRPPVRQGRDVLVRRALEVRRGARAAAGDRGADPRPSSRSPTGSSTSPPATSAPRRPRSTTARPGSRARSATAS